MINLLFLQKHSIQSDEMCSLSIDPFIGCLIVNMFICLEQSSQDILNTFRTSPVKSPDGFGVSSNHLFLKHQFLDCIFDNMTQQSNSGLGKIKPDGTGFFWWILRYGCYDSRSPEKVPVLPAFHRPIFPGILSPISVDNQTSQWLREQISEDKMIAVVMVKPDKLREDQDMLVNASQLYRLGTLAYVLNWVELPDQSCQFMLTLQRIKIKRYQRKQQHYQAEIGYFEDKKIKLTEELKAGAAAIVSTLKELIPQNPTFSQEMFHLLNQVDINDPVMLADLAASMTNAKSEDLQKILETENLNKELKTLCCC